MEKLRIYQTGLETQPEAKSWSSPLSNRLCCEVDRWMQSGQRTYSGRTSERQESLSSHGQLQKDQSRILVGRGQGLTMVVW